MVISITGFLNSKVVLQHYKPELSLPEASATMKHNLGSSHQKTWNNDSKSAKSWDLKASKWVRSTSAITEKSGIITLGHWEVKYQRVMDTNEREMEDNQDSNRTDLENKTKP